jgi:predicted ATPase
MLTRIHANGYKSLRDVEVHLTGLVVLFGPNAAGKSNFLDCLQLLSKLATARTLKDAFEPPYRGKPLESFAFNKMGLKGALEQERLSFWIEADIRLSDAVVDQVNQQVFEMRRPAGENETAAGRLVQAIRERHLRYRIDVEMTPRTGLLRVANEYLAALNDKGEPTGRRQPFLSRHENRLHLRQEGQAHPTYFERFLDHSILSLPHYPPHYPHLVAIRKEMENWQFFYFEPRERMRAATPVKEVRHIGLMGEELAPFLNTLKALEPKQFDAVEKALHAIMPTIDGIGVEVSKLGEVELTLREGGIEIPARLLSEGTLRILGLLALSGAKEQPSLIGFEEPENGIHPRRIQMVAELLKARASLEETQYIVTTHSPLIPDLVSDDQRFICRKIGGGTKIEPYTKIERNRAWGPLASKSAIDDALSDAAEATVADRIQRGDFDA